MKDYYKTLGVGNAATLTDIKRAYRQLAIRYHPDKNPDPAAEQFFKEVNEAYDVLGDETKRNSYDYKIQNPFAEVIITEEPKTYHRDPAYRKKKVNYPPRQSKPSTLDLMRQYLPYFQWLIWTGLVLILVFILDFFLPLQTSREKIIDKYHVSNRRNSTGYDVITTNRNREILLYSYDTDFLVDTEIIITYTPILQAVQEINNISSGSSITLGGIYGPVIIIPLALFITSIFGFLYRKNIEYAFNASIINGILIILIIYLIFST